MKRTVLFIVPFLMIISVCGCGLIHNEKSEQYSEICRRLKMKLPHCIVIEEYEDTHGGFLGDGTLTATLKLGDDEECEAFKENIKETWAMPPFANTLLSNALKYYFEPLEMKFPQENYYYYYLNRYTNNPESMGAYTQNFTLATYIEDKNELYIYASDS